ncbi:hypothetical protein V1477_013485 [Vespula maculifrons]|uniref:Uncharacterized protein n=1 Tax=Vespula maculifrons TaxID=7453 RepID=A0ABD2BQB0_VESMC
MQSRETRFRETTTKSGLGPNFPVTSSVVLWTSTRELRNFRGCHPCKLKCRLGILGLERRQQTTVLDRTLQLLIKMLYRDSRLRETTTKSGLGPTFTVTSSVELWTSTRELRNFRGCHPCKLKCRLGILGLERRQHSTVLDRTLQLLIKMLYRDSRLRETTTKSGLGPSFTVTSAVELWTSTREFRNFRGCHPCKY